MSRVAAWIRGWWTSWTEAFGGMNHRVMRDAYQQAYDEDPTERR